MKVKIVGRSNSCHPEKDVVKIMDLDWLLDDIYAGFHEDRRRYGSTENCLSRSLVRVLFHKGILNGEDLMNIFEWNKLLDDNYEEFIVKEVTIEEE